ncbi:MAG: DUF448 domain-containing protein [Myxococcales bacterium]
MLSVATTKRSEGESVAERTCAGCREVASRADLFRFVHVPGHTPSLVPDLGASLGGHGAWIHPRKDCFVRAARGGFARVFKTQVSVDRDVVLQLAELQVEKRIQGLLLSALRRRQTVLGTDAVREALLAGAPRLLLVAKDAAGRRDELIPLANAKSVAVIELSKKAELGRLTGKETLGFVAILDAHIAREIAVCARWLAGLSEDG